MKLHYGKITVWAIAVGIAALWLGCLPSRLFDNVPYSTVVTASNGELLGARVADDGQWRFPPCDTLNPKFEKALVEYEDRTFYSHFGVSVKGLGRALWQNITSGRVVSGGSTITMQTIRLHRRGKRNIVEKIVEMFMATRLELTHSKAEILRFYASHAPFGGNVVGIEAAMWKYLGHNGRDLSWAEAATLAVLQNAPSAIHLSKNRDALLAKRNRLLKRLYEKGDLSAQEYSLSVEEPLIGEPCEMPSIAPHYVEFCHRVNHGQHSHSDIDYVLQSRVERLAEMRRGELALQGANDLAIVVKDVVSGRLLAYCGNADLSTVREGGWVDIARKPRSSGSILKPLLYCAALQDGLILQHTLLPDIPTDFGGFTPKNYDGMFQGVVDAAEALALSLNVPNVWLLKQYGVARFLSLLQECGFSTLSGNPQKYGLSLILGGGEVTLVDVVECYSRLARYDVKMPLVDSVAIYSMFEAMSSLKRPDELDWSRTSSVSKVAWKTGTSYGSRDAWSIGVTPGYVVGVWVGNADGTGVPALTGASMAAPIMFDVFNMLPSTGWFADPCALLNKVCVKSGQLAGKYCSDTEMQHVCAAARKSRVCEYCYAIPVSVDSLRRVYDASEPSVMKSYFILPPVHKQYFRQLHADFVEPPATQETEGGSSIKFIYPNNGAQLAMPLKTDGTRSVMVCKAAHNNPAERLFWHLDDNYVGSTTDLHYVRLHPVPGNHRLTIYDSSGAHASINFELKGE